jgi:DNA polymerase
MSDDLRADLAKLARDVRRYVERERAAGMGELLAVSAQKTLARDSAAGSSSPPLGAGILPALAEASPVSVHPVLPTGSDSRRRGPTAPSPASLLSEASPLDAPEFSDRLLPSHHAPLNTRDIEARAAILNASLPVLDEIAGQARACQKCALSQTRTNAVPGVGSARSGIVFVGEAPGADEDAQGEPFVGRAGQLLTRIIAAMDEAKLIPGVPLTRETVYICNVLKCRPPENRNPLPNEIESCSPYLRRQLEVLQPRIICCLGKFAAELLVGAKGTIAGLRGKIHRYQGAKLIVTYHPAACLRNPGYKRPVWEDMQMLAREYLTD